MNTDRHQGKGLASDGSIGQTLCIWAFICVHLCASVVSTHWIEDPEELAEEVVLGVGMAAVLAEAFGGGDAALTAALARPLPHRADVFVDAEVLQQQLSLAGVAAEHLDLALER